MRLSSDGDTVVVEGLEGMPTGEIVELIRLLDAELQRRYDDEVPSS